MEQFIKKIEITNCFLLYNNNLTEGLFFIESNYLQRFNRNVLKQRVHLEFYNQPKLNQHKLVAIGILNGWLNGV